MFSLHPFDLFEHHSSLILLVWFKSMTARLGQVTNFQKKLEPVGWQENNGISWVLNQIQKDQELFIKHHPQAAYAFRFRHASMDIVIDEICPLSHYLSIFLLVKSNPHAYLQVAQPSPQPQPFPTASTVRPSPFATCFARPLQTSCHDDPWCAVQVSLEVRVPYWKEQWETRDFLGHSI